MSPIRSGSPADPDPLICETVSVHNQDGPPEAGRTDPHKSFLSAPHHGSFAGSHLVIHGFPQLHRDVILPYRRELC